MSLNHSPAIVTDGLVLCLDAANPRSYPKSGTTWSDLSGNGNHGALQNMENNFAAGTAIRSCVVVYIDNAVMKSPISL